MIEDISIHLDKFIAFCLSEGVKEIVYKSGTDDEYDSENKQIVINRRRTDEHKLYILLHEYGHHHLMQNKNLANKFKAISNRYARNMLTEQILAIEEEVLAWHYGEEAAKALGIPLDQTKFQLLKSRCLRTHIRSYSKILKNHQTAKTTENS
jgi:Zn-dependent peptidase ImmA (M78 family)